MLEMLKRLDITGPLIDLRSNRQGAVDQIYPVVYDELRRRAHWLPAHKGLAIQLEDMVRDESGHSEETQRILQDWPL